VVNGSQLYSTNTKVDNLSDRAVTYDGAVGGAKDTITLAGGTTGTKLTNLKAGTLSASSTDAVNGSQLFDTNTNVTALSTRVTSVATNTSTYLGGGADVAAGTAPTYTIQGTDYNNVGSALGGVNTSLTSLNSKITGITGDVLTWDTSASAYSAKHDDGTGTATNSKITNVAAGTLSDTSTDVVNGSQLYSTNTKVDNLSDRAVTYDGAVGGAKDTITLAGGTTGTKLTNLKAGTLSASSTDAVNGSQLFDTNTNVTALSTRVTSVATNTSTYLGGGADVAAGTAPTYTIQGTDYNNVGSALGGVNTSLTSLNSKITGITGDVLTWDTTASAYSAKHDDGTGTATNSKITNVAAGTLSDTSTDVVNGSQLYSTNTTMNTIATNTSTYLGGGADVAAGTAPTYTIQGSDYNNIGTAFGGVDTALTNLTVGKSGMVLQENSTAPIYIGSKSGGSVISVAGIDGNRRISGVKAGTAADDAVNVAQMEGGLAAIANNVSDLGRAAIVYDKVDGVNDYNNVTLGGSYGQGPVHMKNVAAGELSETSLDAINGSQLYATNNTISTIATNTSTYLGGGANVANGTAPKYTVQGSDYSDVGSAFSGVDSSLTSISSKISGLSNDALSWDSTAGAYSAKHDDGKGNKTNSKIKYLEDGLIADGSTEAVTGNQIYAMNTQIAAYFGGGAGFANGAWTAPSYNIYNVDSSGKVTTGTYNNVGDALGGVNDSINNVNNRVNDVEDTLNNFKPVDENALQWNDTEGGYDAGGKNNQPNKIVNVADGNIAQGSKDAVNGGQLWDTNKRVDNIEASVGDIADGAAMYDKDSNGNKTNSLTLQGGDASKPVTIANVADGKIETGSKEAVNGGQLHDYTQAQMTTVLDQSKSYTDQRVDNIVSDAVEQSNQYTDMRFGELNYGIHEAKREARQAAAIGLAASSLRFDDNPGKVSVAFGSGFWRSEGAVAMGAGYTSEDGKIRSNLSATSAGGNWGVGAGLSFTLN
ncbi:YadA-like family protein, partial [Bartonella sp. LJL80]